MDGRRLEGRVALVTGAAQGIGRALVQRLGDEGAAIVVNDLREDACAATAAELQAAGIRAVGAHGDVTSSEDADRVVATATEAFGGLDILVNNAGITRDVPLQRMSDAEWRAVHEVVLWGTFCMTRACAAALRGSRDAPPAHHRKVVNMSSIVGVYGAPGTTNYSAAKAGVIGLTRALAREWGRSRVNVNAVAPGLVSGTGLVDEKPPELVQRVIDQLPFGRPASPQDIAAAVAFLASPDSDLITGQVLEVTGGLEIPA
ncbi:glucose 1-dehydrogenase [Baekduia soli]|uniref:Glucose 1-dehydrogenase n=1 Tax=Baekduia soli TaxID=496014 RepID=A0A5B8UBM2_9ACTN|nr:glucose 1-dehydrogenase [Baekduia soli]QEC50556.1 glucose 1-dehydrogenase [Baekduia soli]